MCSSSTSALIRASRIRFSSSLARAAVSPSISRTPGIGASSANSSSPSLIGYRSLSSLSSFRSLRSSVPRWSHGVDWRSPVSLRAQIRTATPVIERFQRKIATMGIQLFCSQFLFIFSKAGRLWVDYDDFIFSDFFLVSVFCDPLFGDVSNMYTYESLLRR